MIHMLLVWSLHYSRYLSADKTWEHLDGKTAPEDFSLPTSSTNAIRRSCGRKYRLLSLGLGDEIYQKTSRSYGGGGWNFSQHKRRKLRLKFIFHLQQVWSCPGVATCRALIIHTSQSLAIPFTARAPQDRWRREKKGAFTPTQEFPCSGKCKLEHYY